MMAPMTSREPSGADDARRRHYARFYGLEATPSRPGDPGPATPSEAPTTSNTSDAAASTPTTAASTAWARVCVIGNCQAESLRIVLHSSGVVDSYRVPPIHEWEPGDIPWAQSALQSADILVAQPVRDGYRGMPIGTRQLQAFLPPTARTVLVPVLRYDGLHPYQAIIRPPADPSLDPPVVPYHDLRTLVAAATGSGEPVAPRPSASQLREAAEYSRSLMAARERAFGLVPMSDVLATAPVWHTINHPDNRTLEELGNRVYARLGLTHPGEAARGQELAVAEAPAASSVPETSPSGPLGAAPLADLDGGGIPEVGEPSSARQDRQTPAQATSVHEPACSAPADREMLGRLRAPVDPDAARALGVPDAVDGREEWTLEGRTLNVEDIFAAQMEFYAENPDVVPAGLARHRERLIMLGFGPYLPNL